MRERGKLEKDKSCKTFSKLAKLKLVRDDDILNLDEYVEEMKF